MTSQRASNKPFVAVSMLEDVNDSSAATTVVPLHWLSSRYVLKYPPLSYGKKQIDGLIRAGQYGRAVEKTWKEYPFVTLAKFATWDEANDYVEQRLKNAAGSEKDDANLKAMKKVANGLIEKKEATKNIRKLTKNSSSSALTSLMMNNAMSNTLAAATTTPATQPLTSQPYVLPEESPAMLSFQMASQSSAPQPHFVSTMSNASPMVFQSILPSTIPMTPTPQANIVTTAAQASTSKGDSETMQYTQQPNYNSWVPANEDVIMDLGNLTVLDTNNEFSFNNQKFIKQCVQEAVKEVAVSSALKQCVQEAVSSVLKTELSKIVATIMQEKVLQPQPKSSAGETVAVLLPIRHLLDGDETQPALMKIVSTTIATIKELTDLEEMIEADTEGVLVGHFVSS